MIVARRLRWRQIIHYTWKSLLYFIALSVAVYILHVGFDLEWVTIPFNAVATLSTALAIYLGFKNNNAYERWWEARKIWGLLVNYSRAWAREILSLLITQEGETDQEIEAFQRR